MANYRIYVEVGGDFSRVIPVGGATAPSLPAWLLASVGASSVTVSIDSGPAAGTYTYDFGTFTLIVTSLASLLETREACCTGSSNIAYLNRLGGWENMNFEGVREYEGRFDGNESIVVSDRTLRRVNIGDVYDGEVNNTKRLSLEGLSYLWRLRHSIAHYRDINEDGTFSQELIIDREELKKRKSNSAIYQGSVRFRVAEKLEVQRR